MIPLGGGEQRGRDGRRCGCRPRRARDSTGLLQRRDVCLVVAQFAQHLLAMLAKMRRGTGRWWIGILKQRGSPSYANSTEWSVIDLNQGAIVHYLRIVNHLRLQINLAHRRIGG